MRELYNAADLELLTNVDFFLEPLNMLFGDIGNHLKVADFFVAENDDGRVASIVLAVKQDLFLQLPGMQGYGLGIIVESPDEWPLIHCEIETGASSQSLTVQHFPLRIEIANPLLKPVPIEGEAAVLEGFSFEIEGGFSVATDLSISARLESFSVPPFEIVGTGLTLALETCRLITSADDVDSAINALGFNEHYRGLHASAALFDWDLPLQLNGQDLPGIHARLDNLALGNQGVSTDAQLSWPVAYQQGAFDAAGTEMLGYLAHPDWACALAGLNLSIRANVPTAVAANGYLRIAALEAIFQLELALAYAGNDDYETQATLRLGESEQIAFPLGHPEYRVRLQSLEISGSLQDGDTLELQGETACEVSLPGVSVQAERASLQLLHEPERELFELELQQIAIDTLGTVEQAHLIVEFKRDADGDMELARLELSANAEWSDLSGRIALAQLPDAFPLPPDDGEVALKAHWNDNELLLSVESTLQDVDRLWRFIPDEVRPEVAEASIRVHLQAQGNDFNGEAALGLRLRLPDISSLPGLAAAGLGQFVLIDTGDDEGWIDAEFAATIDSSDNNADTTLSASLQSPISLAFQLPGLELPEPPLQLHIENIALDLANADDETSGEFVLDGNFTLHPILPSDLGGLVPAPMALQLERLLAVAHLTELVGSAELRTGVADDGAYLAVACEFANAGIELDLFDMLAGITSQLAANNPQGEEIDLDIEVSFALSRLSLELGHVPDSDLQSDTALPFRFGLAAELGFAGQYTELVFALSSEALSFGFTELAIPLMIPQLPLSREDLDKLRDEDGDWALSVWQEDIEPLIDQRLLEAETALQAARDTLEALDDPSNPDDELLWHELRYRTIPALQKDIFHFTGKKFLTEAALAIHQLLGQLSTESAQQSYQQMVEVYQDAVDLTLGWVQFDTGLQFVIRDAQFVLPFNDPSNIRVAGSASLQGFAPESPLRPLADLQFTLGLSADAIFFEVEGGADPILLPDFGRYPGNAVRLDRLLIGYGYSKNSLLVDFAGELQLSPQLVEDLDSSRRLGAGVRLPTNNRLKFKIDLIPIVLGEVDFLLPLVAFDIDLRSEQAPPPSQATPCAPAWDGLQFIAPGILRADLKRAKFSPFFGPLPAPNYLYSFDIDVGDKQIGLTQVCDTYQVISPVLGSIPIPFLADGSPYFERLCSNLRLAGFGINFELRRPFPHPSPLVVFELMGFLADPSLPIDPAGHLADLMWAELRNGRISLPPAVVGMFPAAGPFVNRDFEARIDVGHVITFGQQLAAIIQRLQQGLADAGNDMADAIEALTGNPPEVDVSTLLEGLPRELRRVEVEGAFIGFRASAVFLLVDPANMRSRLALPGTPPQTPQVQWKTLVQDTFTHGPLEGWRVIDHGLKRGKGDWRIDGGALVQHNNVGDNSPGRYGAMLIRETGDLSDIRITVDMHSTDNDGMGVLFHVQGNTSFYRFRITAEQGEWQLTRLKRGRTHSLQTTRSSFTPGKDYRVRIETRSVVRAAATLPGPMNPRRPSPTDLLSTGTLNQQATHIRIWVNDSLWCDLADRGNPLTTGEVGLDSWWNQGARFDNFTIETAQREGMSLHDAAGSGHDRLPLVADTDRFLPISLPDTAWSDEELAGFTPNELAAALASDAPGVVVAARVAVLDSQVYRFIGTMQSDGHFTLMSSATIDPLRLSIAGVDRELVLNIGGQLLLQGRSAGADSQARLEAMLYGNWPIDSSTNRLAVLRIGSASDPLRFALDSRGGFRARGDGELQLFDEQIVIAGELDLSHRHAFIRGGFEFSPALFSVSQQRLLALSLTVEGRVGPGRDFALRGDGALQLFGRDFNQVSATLDRSGIELETRLDADGASWPIRGFDLADAAMRLRGRIGFDTSPPSLLLEGNGRFNIGDLRIDGLCRVRADGGGWCIGMGGKLHWQGRDWLQGELELCRDELTLRGNTSFAVNLTPTQLPANIQIAGLYLSASVGGSFTVRSSQRLKACAFDIEWTLSIRLPGGHERQMIPIATQHLPVEKEAIASSASIHLIDLIDIDGWQLLPLDGVTLPVPTLSGDTTDIYLHESVRLDPPSTTLPVPLITTTQPNDTPPPAPVFTVPLTNIHFYVDQPEIDVPGFDLPVPILSDRTPDSDPTADPLLSLPSINIEQVALDGALQLDQLKLGLKLAWKDGELGIKVTQTGAFHAFGSLPPLPFHSGRLTSRAPG